MSNWTTANIPAQRGKVAVVTGPTSGAGFHIALELARAGAEVVLAARNPHKRAQAIEQIRAQVPQAQLAGIELDLTSLASVHRFAETFGAEHKQLDLLVNNAGVATIPYQRTVDGFEMQLGINHLGHFALTGLLLPQLLASPIARVVTVASGASNTGKINFEDLQSEHHYSRYGAYGQSKLANLLFALEFQRRLDTAGLSLKSIASQPGWTATNLGPGEEAHPVERGAWRLLNRLFAHSAAGGAVPSLYAATVPNLAGGTYISPTRFGGLHGPPAIMTPGKAAQNSEVAARLWTRSEELTEVHYDLIPTSSHAYK